MTEKQIIYCVHKWHKEVYFIKENINCKLLVTANFLQLKEIIFRYLNQVDFEKKEIKGFISYYSIKNFTSIPKKTIRKMPLENRPGLRNHEDPTYQIVVKYLKILFLTFNIAILEDQNAKKQNVDEFIQDSRRQKRDGQIFEILTDLYSFLQRYGFDKQPIQEHHILLKKALELDFQLKIIRNCYNNLARHGVHSSVYVRAMTAGYMKEDFEDSRIKEITAKKNKKFVNKKGEPDIQTLNETRRIENADDGLCSYDDIGDLVHSWNYRRLTDLGILYNDKSLFEKAKSPFNGYYLANLSN